MNVETDGDGFLMVVSHELRTPTAAILEWIELLRSRTLNDTILAQGIETIKRNAQLQDLILRACPNPEAWVWGSTSRIV